MSAEKEFNPWFFKVEIAEQAERYDDMVMYMEEVVNMRHQEKEDLSKEERNCLSVAYKNVIGSRRAAWRITSSIEQKQTTRDNPNAQKLSIIKEYKLKVEKELDDKCEQILGILDRYLLAESEGMDIVLESKVFYHKMKGDYYRYMAEYKTGDERTLVADKASEAYKEAQNIGSKEGKDGLASTHPIRLGVALNYSVFHHEIQNNPEEACKLAKKAIDEAIAELDSLKEENYKDSALIMSLMRDNLTLWSSENQDDHQGEEGQD